MFSLLHQYLITYSCIGLPGIGILQFVDTSAQPLADEKIMPPKREIKLVNNNIKEVAPQLIGFISKQLGMTEMQAQTLFQHFLQSIKNKLAEKQTVQWENVGEFKKDNNGNFQFIQTADLDIYYQPIDAERTSHHNRDKYDVLAGDNETNVVATQHEWNTTANVKKSNWWWIWAIVIGVVALVIIAVKYVY